MDRRKFLAGLVASTVIALTGGSAFAKPIKEKRLKFKAKSPGSLLEITKSQLNASTKHFSSVNSEMITALNGQSGHWLAAVDGELVLTAPSNCLINQGSQIEWIML